MRALAAIAAQHGGRVLEVGFGMGISARHLQADPMAEHWVIEANTAVFQAARAFAATASTPMTLLLGFWEDVVPTLPDAAFEGILFDTYPLRPDDLHQNHFPFFHAAHRLLKPGATLTYYSDEVSSFSPDHLDALHRAGFIDVRGHVCAVNPPESCKYWTSKTIPAPIVMR